MQDELDDEGILVKGSFKERKMDEMREMARRLEGKRVGEGERKKLMRGIGNRATDLGKTWVKEMEEKAKGKPIRRGFPPIAWILAIVLFLIFLLAVLIWAFYFLPSQIL